QKQATELNILTSRTLAEAVVHRTGYQLQLVPPSQMLTVLHHLHRQVKSLFSWRMDIPYLALPRQPNVSLWDVGVTDKVGLARYTITFLQDGAFAVQTAENRKEIGKGKLGQTFRSQLFAFRLESEDAQAGDKISLILRPLQSAVSQLHNNIKASVLRGSEVIRLVAHATSPELAKTMATALIQEYIAFSLQRKTQEASQELNFIKQRLSATHASLQTREGELRHFKEAKKFVTLSGEAESNLKQITQFDTTLKQIQTSLQEAEELQRRLQRRGSSMDLDRGTISTLGNAPESSLLHSLAGRLSDLVIQEQALRVKYGTKHPNVQQVKAQIQEVKTKMVTEVSTLIANLQSREAALRGIIRQYEARLGTLPQAEQELANLTRQTQINGDVYAFLLKKREDAQILEARTISKVHMIDPPVTPGNPIQPKLSLNLIVAATLGLVLGLGLAYFVEYLDDTIKTLEEAEQQVGLPLLGAIPEIPVRSNPGQGLLVVPQLAGGKVPGTAAAEALHSLRTNLQFSDIGGAPRKKLAITSPQVGDGKTTVVANLALSFAAMGHKILLVDADLRRPQLAQIFNAPREPGLVETLRAEIRWSEAVRVVRENCHLLTSGAIPPNPSELLASRRMRALLSKWEAVYDYILVDAPAVMAVTDPVVVGTLCQGVLLVVRAHKTSPLAIRRALAQLDMAHIPTVGVVVNGLKLALGYGNYSNRDNYYYNNHSKSEQRHSKRRQNSQTESLEQLLANSRRKT
ncbi:MAG TPA: polysaccharide biosynthesis tyrosine autokinase, partial [Candidatus Tectomicrobia bacterium]